MISSANTVTSVLVKPYADDADKGKEVQRIAHDGIDARCNKISVFMSADL